MENLYELQQFTEAGQILIDAMEDPKYPTMTQKQKTEIFNKFVDYMDDSTLARFIGTVLKNVNMSEKESQEYKNVEEQCASIITRIPRLGNHREEVAKAVKEAREQWSLIL